MENNVISDYHVSVLDSLDDFQKLTSIFDTETLSRNSTFFYFNSPQWMQSSWDYVEKSKGSRPFILVAEDGKGKIAGWWPLLVSKRRIGRRLQSFGQEYSDYSSPFVFDGFLSDYEKIVDAMLACICDNRPNYSMCFLQNLYLPHIEEKFVPAKLKDSCPNWKVMKKAKNFYINFGIHGSMEDLINKIFSGKFKKSRMYEKKRSLENRGELCMLEAKGDDLEEIEKYYNKNYKYAGAAENSLKLKVWFDFFRRTLGSLTWISILKYDGRIINTIIFFQRGDDIDFFSTVYDDTIGNYSPGNIHLYFFIRKLFDEKANRLNFLTGDEKYKQQWSDGEYHTFRTFLYHKNNLSGLILSIKNFKSWMKASHAQGY